MDNNNFFSNKSFGYCEDNENENNSFFFNNKEDNLLHSYNEEVDEEYNNFNDMNNNNINNNELLFTDSFPNNNFNLKLDNSLQLNNGNNIFQENNSLKDISSIGHTTDLKNDEDSNINNSSSLNNISNNSSSTKEKSQFKKDNIYIVNNNNIINQKEEINENINKEALNKKRKQRIHLEDLGLDPEFIKDKKFETIGDKVFLSKNKILTEEDKKEVRAIRNRISAQKSRDKKKAEFSLFQKQIKYLNEILKQKNLLIENYEKVCCPQCKAKFEEINKKIISEKSDINVNKENFNNNSNEEELVLEEEGNKNNSLFGKLPMLLIGIVCLIGISLCIFQYQYSNTNRIIPLRNLKINNPINLNNINSTSEKEKLDENFIIYEEPNSPRQTDINTNLKEIEDNEFLQMCHDKFIFDVYSNHKKKKDLEDKQKTGFLVKKTYNNIDPNSFCFESQRINNGDYIINNNNLTNTLPIQRDNIILNEYISNKIISVFIKDYESLKKYSDGKLLTLKEQIEKSAKNSQDGCIYLQLIMPKNEIENDYEKKNDTCPNNNEKYFEIRCKILSYFNYYDGDRI